MRHKNKIQTDYTLAYLKFLSGFRSSPPSARAYGLTADEAARKRAEVDICLGRTTTVNTVA